MSDDDITITADGAKIMAAEKVSTGDYENAQVSATLDVSIEGADVSDGISESLRKKLYGLKRQLQAQVRAAADERRRSAEEPDADRSHEV